MALAGLRGLGDRILGVGLSAVGGRRRLHAATSVRADPTVLGFSSPSASLGRLPRRAGGPPDADAGAPARVTDRHGVPGARQWRGYGGMRRAGVAHHGARARGTRPGAGGTTPAPGAGSDRA